MNIAKLRPYLLAENIRRENDSFNAWLSGLYVYDAVSKAIAGAFRKKGARAPKYMEKPIRITPYTKEEKLAMEKKEREKAIAFFNAMYKNAKNKETKVVTEHGV